jgi:multiple sugar transport system permease protein
MNSSATSPPAVAPFGEAALPRKRKAVVSRRPLTGFLYVLPSLVFLMIFFVAPLILMFYVSTRDWPLIAGDRGWNDFANYTVIPENSRFFGAIGFTLLYALVTTVVVFLSSFFIVGFAASKRRGARFYRTIYFLPFVVGSAPATLIWLSMVNDQTGIINDVLIKIGILDEPFGFLSTPEKAIFTLLTLAVWKGTGFTMMILLVGLSSIEPELYEAARMDGANIFQRLRYITLPYLTPTLALMLVLSVTGGLLAYDQFVLLTQGSQFVTLVYVVVSTAFTSFDLGRAVALGVILTFALILLNAVQLRLLRRKDA